MTVHLRFIPQTLREWNRVFADLNQVSASALQNPLDIGDANPGYGYIRLQHVAGVFTVTNKDSFAYPGADYVLFSVTETGTTPVIDLKSTPTLNGAELSMVLRGTGSPEGIVTAEQGTLYLRTDGGVNTTLYVKESGSGDTGWAAK